jgi:hypothetical protein
MKSDGWKQKKMDGKKQRIALINTAQCRFFFQELPRLSSTSAVATAFLVRIQELLK